MKYILQVYFQCKEGTISGSGSAWSLCFYNPSIQLSVNPARFEQYWNEEFTASLVVPLLPKKHIYFNTFEPHIAISQNPSIGVFNFVCILLALCNGIHLYCKRLPHFGMDLSVQIPFQITN